ncbi:MAG: hypothetical protein OIF58_10565 [Cohaesibacter sp.]|nr:hypothetical protein [Cohaesibacter sp.]
MRKFRYIDDVETWLEPMDYQGFWVAITSLELDLQPRAHCDQQIRDGEVDQVTVLRVLKSMARIELTDRHRLEWKQEAPWLRLVQ